MAPAIKTLANLVDCKYKVFTTAHRTLLVLRIGANDFALHAFACLVAKVKPLLLFDTAEETFVDKDATCIRLNCLFIVLIINVFVDLLYIKLYLLCFLLDLITIKSGSPTLATHLFVVSFPQFRLS